MPPVPPGEFPPQEVQKTRIVAEVLERLGRETEPQVVAEHIKSLGLDIEPDEVAAIRSELLKRASTPPGPDQPPPQEARRTPLTGPGDGGPTQAAGASPVVTNQETG